MVDPTPSDYHLTYLRDRWERDRSSRVFLQLAEEYRRRGLHAEALEVLLVGLSHHPGYLAAQVSLGRCRLEAGQLQEATEVLERVLTQDPTQAVASRLLVEARLRLRDARGVREAIARCQLLGVVPPQELQVFQQRLAELVTDEQPEPPVAPLLPPELPPAVEQQIEAGAVEADAVEPAAVELDAVEPQPEPAPSALLAAEAIDLAAIARPGEQAGPGPDTSEDATGKLPLRGGVREAPQRSAPPPAAALPATPATWSPAQQHSARDGEVFRLPAHPPAALALATRGGGSAPRRLVRAAVAPSFALAANPAAHSATLVGSDPAEVFALVARPAAPTALLSARAAEAPTAGVGVAELEPSAAEPLALEPGGGEEPVAPPAAAVPASVIPEDPRLATLPPPLPSELAPPPTAEPVVEEPPLVSSPPFVAEAAPDETPAGSDLPWWRPQTPSAMASPADALPAAAPPAVEPRQSTPTPPPSAPVAAPVAAAPAPRPPRPQPLADTAGVEVQRGGSLPAPELRASDPGTATLGELYLRQGHVGEAEKIFRQVLTRDPENETALRGLEAIGRRRTAALTAAELVSGDEPEVRGVTARKILLLKRYMHTVRRGAESDVPRATE